MKKEILIPLVFLLLAVFLVSGQQGCPAPEQAQELTGEQIEEKTEETYELPETGWRDGELTDVLTGKTFKISDFKGKPILLESFAVWCPTCLQQQRKIKELIAQESEGEVIHISIDTDPNEDAQQIIDHANENDLVWLFAISPTAYTLALIDEFTTRVIAAPTAPVILICDDPEQTARLLKRGVKSANELKEEIAKGCDA